MADRSAHLRGGTAGRISEMNQTLWQIASSLNSRFIGHDRRTRFRDLAKVAPGQRSAASKIINFYSSVDNIGNFTPVLGIRDMIGVETDTWNIHDRGLDFDFVNRQYACAIIGGAGLLDSGFLPFWQKFARDCRIPTIIWGVGVCAPDSAVEKGVDPAVFRLAAAKCDLINVRDDLTAEYYSLKGPSITPCPTIAYTQRFLAAPVARSRVLHASHDQLVSRSERDALRETLAAALGPVDFTDNIQRPLRGIEDIVSKYNRSRLVVTTRLHGAIIAYGLGVPYLALARDEKLRAFHRLYGNGRLVETVQEIGRAVKTEARCERPVRYDDVRQFGQRVDEWLRSVGAHWTDSHFRSIAPKTAPKDTNDQQHSPE